MNLKLSSITHCSAEKFFEEFIVPNFILEKRHPIFRSRTKNQNGKAKNVEIKYFLHSTQFWTKK